MLGVCSYNVFASTLPRKIGQSRLAPAASQDFYKQLEFSCKRLPSPKRHIHDIQLSTSLFISGLIHAAADYSLHQNFSEAQFIQLFVLQAAAITFEDALIAVASRLGYKESKGFKLIGFIWVFAWFACSTPMYFNHQVQAQGTVDKTNNFSLIRMLKSFSGEFFGNCYMIPCNEPQYFFPHYPIYSLDYLLSFLFSIHIDNPDSVLVN